jgi:hypothetical protein
MTTASLNVTHSRPDHARATTPRGTCTTAEGLDAETFRGFQLAGELFLLTSFFIEPEGSASASYLGTRFSVTSEFSMLFWLTAQWHLLAQIGQTAWRPTWKHRHSTRRDRFTAAVNELNSHCLRMAVPVWLTAGRAR